jgi:glutathione S-transferase
MDPPLQGSDPLVVGDREPPADQEALPPASGLLRSLTRAAILTGGAAVGAALSRLCLGAIELLLNVAASLLGALLDFPYFDLPFIGRPLDAMTASMAVLVRCMSGRVVASGLSKCERPTATITLFEAQGSPACRKVRECLDVLDLDALIYPCPAPSLLSYFEEMRSFMRFIVGGSSGYDAAGCKAFAASRYAEAAAAAAASAANGSRTSDPTGRRKRALPVLVDGSITICGADPICAYLWRAYGGNATAPLNYRIGLRLDEVALLRLLPSLLRPLPRHGLVLSPSRQPAERLLLWGYESSPFVMRVREALCTLQLPHLAIHIPMGSAAKRHAFIGQYKGLLSAARRAAPQLNGAPFIQVPALLDPNQPQRGLLLESTEIVRYAAMRAREGLPRRRLSPRGASWCALCLTWSSRAPQVPVRHVRRRRRLDQAERLRARCWGTATGGRQARLGCRHRHKWLALGLHQGHHSRFMPPHLTPTHPLGHVGLGT